jgi:hypothetical protein
MMVVKMVKMKMKMKMMACLIEEIPDEIRFRTNFK